MVEQIKKEKAGQDYAVPTGFFFVSDYTVPAIRPPY